MTSIQKRKRFRRNIYWMCCTEVPHNQGTKITLHGLYLRISNSEEFVLFQQTPGNSNDLNSANMFDIESYIVLIVFHCKSKLNLELTLLSTLSNVHS